jgi:hypothetical protein
LLESPPTIGAGAAGTGFRSAGAAAGSETGGGGAEGSGIADAGGITTVDGRLSARIFGGASTTTALSFTGWATADGGGTNGLVSRGASLRASFERSGASNNI